MSDTKYSTINQIKKAIKGTYSVSIVLSDNDSKDKLTWLKNAKRDFLKVTPEMTNAGVRALDRALGETVELSELVIKSATQALGDAIVHHIANRFIANTDVRMSPLSPAYIRFKGHSKIGVLSGDLFRDIVNAKAIVTKIK